MLQDIYIEKEENTKIDQDIYKEDIMIEIYQQGNFTIHFFICFCTFISNNKFTTFRSPSRSRSRRRKNKVMIILSDSGII